MTSSWYLTRPVAGSGPVVAYRGPSAAKAVEPEPETEAPAPRPARGAVRTRRAHATHPARPPRRAHRHTFEEAPA